MRALILLRHGKSDWAADSGDDRERPLARRGEKSSRTIGRFLARAGQVPDSAIASPARRAQETLRLVMAAGELTCPVRSAEALYGGGVAGLIAEVQRESDGTELLLAIGHEPTWSEAATALIGGGRVRFPTAAAARVDFDVERWEDVGPGTGELAWCVVPRLLEGEGS
jgi:phosphohistidine phosphatase